jgi:hypothetical protein
MDPSPYLWLASMALFIGGLTATAGLAWLGLADPGRTGTASGWYLINAMVMSGGGLIAVGIPAIHEVQAEHAGWVGAVGVVVLSAGMMTAYLAVQGIEMINHGLPRRAVPITFVALPCLAIGAILTAVVSLRAAVMPAALPVALLVSIAAGALTLLPNLPARINTWIPTMYTAVFAVWGWSLIDSMR